MKIIVANWKMNGDANFIKDFMEEINQINTKNTVIVCPPTGLICSFSEFRYHIGAQNCFCEEFGAFTGENSPKLLKEIGCRYVIVGHSERRTIFCETDDLIFKKWNAAIKQELIPIVCVGESLENRSRWKEVLSEQLKLFSKQELKNTIFAYEPVWSIGTGLIPTLEEIEEILEFIKNTLNLSGSLLYGGSANATNAAQILSCKNTDGLLVGGASLKIEEFKKIIQI